MAASSTAYQGLWVDHYNDRLLLTLSSTSAGFLSAALIVWVHFLAFATWPVFRFALWAARRKSGKVHDVFHAQRNLLLRNSGSAQGALAQLLRVMVPWGRRNKKFAFRGLPYLLVALLVFVAWTVAAVFVPYIYTHAGDTMLISSSPHCGVLVLNHDSTANLALSLQSETNQATQGQTYVRQCYNTAQNNAACSIYPRISLPFSIQNGTACPAATEDICITPNATVLQLDTGLLNSNADLGIDAPHYEQINYRHLATCSPIDIVPFTTSFTVSATDTSRSAFPPGTILSRYYMGSSLGSSYTWQYSDLQSVYESTYGINVFPYFAGNISDEVWYPNATLFDAPNTDATLIFVSGNQVKSFTPGYDPIFSAGKFSFDTVHQANETPSTVYLSSYPVTALLCTEQHQVCAADDSSRCTPLVGAYEILNASFAMTTEPFSDSQQATIFRIASAAQESILSTVIEGRGSFALLASQTVTDGYQTAALPKDQWVIEVQNWFSVSLAVMQANILSFATGPSEPALWPFVETLVGDVDVSHQCSRQRVAALAGYTNFDFAGILVLLVVGVILIPIGLLFERVVHLLARVLRLTSLQRLHEEWIADTMFQVQRTALESSAGVREWQHTESTVPLSWQLITPGCRSESGLKDGSDE